MNGLVLPHTAYADTGELDAELDAWAAYLRMRARDRTHRPAAGPPPGPPAVDPPDPAAADPAGDLPAWLASWFRQDLSGTTRRQIAVAWQLGTFTAAEVAAATATDRERAWRSIELLRRRRLLTLRRQGNVQVYTWRRPGG